MLGSGNEFDVIFIENFKKGVKIFVVAGEAVDLVDHHSLDALPLDILDKLFQGRAVERSPGLSGILINLEDLPAKGFLTLDISNTAVPLVIERGIRLRFRPLVHRDPRINSAINDIIFRGWVHSDSNSTSDFHKMKALCFPFASCPFRLSERSGQSWKFNLSRSGFFDFQGLEYGPLKETERVAWQ